MFLWQLNGLGEELDEVTKGNTKVLFISKCGKSSFTSARARKWKSISQFSPEVTNIGLILLYGTAELALRIVFGVLLPVYHIIVGAKTCTQPK